MAMYVNAPTLLQNEAAMAAASDAKSQRSSIVCGTCSIAIPTDVAQSAVLENVFVPLCPFCKCIWTSTWIRSTFPQQFVEADYTREWRQHIEKAAYRNLPRTCFIYHHIVCVASSYKTKSKLVKNLAQISPILEQLAQKCSGTDHQSYYILAEQDSRMTTEVEGLVTMPPRIEELTAKLIKSDRLLTHGLSPFKATWIDLMPSTRKRADVTGVETTFRHLNTHSRILMVAFKCTTPGCRSYIPFECTECFVCKRAYGGLDALKNGKREGTKWSQVNADNSVSHYTFVQCEICRCLNMHSDDPAGFNCMHCGVQIGPDGNFSGHSEYPTKFKSYVRLFPLQQIRAHWRLNSYGDIDRNQYTSLPCGLMATALTRAVRTYIQWETMNESKTLNLSMASRDDLPLDYQSMRKDIGYMYVTGKISPLMFKHLAVTDATARRQVVETTITRMAQRETFKLIAYLVNEQSRSVEKECKHQAEEQAQAVAPHVPVEEPVAIVPVPVVDADDDADTTEDEDEYYDDTESSYTTDRDDFSDDELDEQAENEVYEWIDPEDLKESVNRFAKPRSIESTCDFFVRLVRKWMEHDYNLLHPHQPTSEYAGAAVLKCLQCDTVSSAISVDEYERNHRAYTEQIQF